MIKLTSTDEKSMKNQRDTYLYEQLANDLAKAIHSGEYSVDEKLPSLRYVSEQYDVSMATTIQAYQHLEQSGLIFSRPKSGYFVSQWTNEEPEVPVISQPRLNPTEVNVAHLAMSLITESRQPGLIKLGAAVPEADLLPLASLSRTLAGVARRKHLASASYEDAQGNIELRKQISRIMREAGVRCSADDIIITNGCLEALGLALRVVANSGDTIAIESPTYFGILQVIEALGMKALEIATHPVTGIEVDALKQAIAKRKISACILMPTFNNPLASTMPKEHIKQVVELLEKNNIPLIEDDIYGSLSYEPRRPKAAKAYDDSGNVLYCSSFSKTVAPGLRIGWMLPGKFKEQTRHQKFLENISTSIYPQLTLAEFLEKGRYRKCIRHAALVYKRRMDQLRRWVADAFPEGTRITSPKGGFVLWVELPKKYDAVSLYRKAMEKKIAITPGILFSAQGQYKNHIRLSCGSVDGELARKTINTLAKLLK